MYVDSNRIRHDAGGDGACYMATTGMLFANSRRF
jgi:hypothetical protein